MRNVHLVRHRRVGNLIGDHLKHVGHLLKALVACWTRVRRLGEQLHALVVQDVAAWWHEEVHR
jgi:hypothetical protein